MNDIQLVSELKEAVTRERACASEVLRYLREIEQRALYLARGYGSLFSFCVGELGYSEPEAMLRVQAVRLVKKVPEVEGKLGRGEISLTVASQVASVMRREKLGLGEVRELVEEVSGCSKREAERRLAARFPQAKKRERTKAISGDLVEIRFTVTREEAELFARLMDRKTHTNFERKYEALFVALATAELKKLEGTDTEQLLPDKVRPRTRHIPTRLKQKVWRRDQGQCQYVDPLTKRRCESSHGLQLDHRQPFAQGGPHTEANLRLHCGAHNRFRNSG